MTTLRRLLLGLNGLLVLGIPAFALKGLVAQPRIDRLQDIRAIDASVTSTGKPPSPDESVFSKVRNPITLEDHATSPAPFHAFTLKGALPAEPPHQGVAFMRSASRPIDLTARTGEAIHRDGKPDPEFAGWRLADVWKDRAVFINLAGERQELRIESLGLESPSSTPQGDCYLAETFKSRTLTATESREVWGMDPAEVEWAGRNAALMLDRDVRIMPIPGQGLRIESIDPGSMAAARGLKPGDLVLEVNGRPLKTLNDLQSLQTDAGRSALRLTIERTGRPFVLEYHPLPR